MAADENSLEPRVRKLEILYVGLKANADLVDPKKTIEFQASVVSSFKAADKEIKYLKSRLEEYRVSQYKATNRRIRLAFMGVAFLLTATQILLSIFNK